ncbi:aldehyde dehydrogenase 3, member A2 [Apophysomyces sp. BC1034]|nr:aldehyde dehydrogenase 3, member A2 [Apophysomyces sp. BC1015]KAG0179339.1 aldehyde dehydrogenase 3, member A2 [Apophysomyces sp. BC1021]KAG0190268.1 aldehyde dehydrogenase 3, member A2 [Apophysomyces sp. BC1034]
MASLTYTPKGAIPTIVSKLRENFDTGITKNIAFRKEQLGNLVRCLEENGSEFEEALWKDLRKHKMECGIGEISPIIDECKYMIKNLDRLSKPTHTSKRFMMNSMDKTYIRKEAKGVVLVIGAWNYPVNLLLLPAVGAIAAGNCVVFKPSEVAAHTAAAMARLLPKYLDERAYSVINGGVVETTELLEQRLDHIFYTGNGMVGRIVMTAAAKHLTPVTLELGGKSPAIVAPDADLEVAANRLVFGKFFNNGQTCVAPDYVLVEKNRAGPLLAACKNAIVQFYGEDAQKSESYGRIVSTRQFDRLKALLDGCDPASILAGGQTDRDDLFIAPTLVSPVTIDADLMQQEIFGPILPVVTVENMDEAIQIVKSKDHPLAMYIFSNSANIYNNILDNTNSGGVLVNDTLMHLQELSLPFGGVGPSGTGAYHGDKSFDTFTHERSTMVKSAGLESIISVRYPPYNADKYTLITLLVTGLPKTVGAKVKTLANAIAASKNVLFAKKEV